MTGRCIPGFDCKTKLPTDLDITEPANVPDLPQVVGDADLALMRRLDELHLEHPFMGARMLRDQLGRSGNRTEFQAERRIMMQAWADYLDKLRKGADIISLPTKGPRKS